MCRHITKDQRIEGWRATAELISAFRPHLGGVTVAVLAAWLHRSLFAAGHAFANPIGARHGEAVAQPAWRRGPGFFKANL